MIRNHLKHSWRGLVKNKTYSLLNMAGLTAGAAGSIVIVVALLTVISRAIKAAIANPIRSLRTE